MYEIYDIYIYKSIYIYIYIYIAIAYTTYIVNVTNEAAVRLFSRLTTISREIMCTRTRFVHGDDGPNVHRRDFYRV